MEMPLGLRWGGRKERGLSYDLFQKPPSFGSQFLLTSNPIHTYHGKACFFLEDIGAFSPGFPYAPGRGRDQGLATPD